MLLTSAPSDRSPGHHTWGRSPGPVPNEPRHDGEQPSTQPAAAVAGVGRKKPWKPTVRHELPAARSPPFLNQISQYQEPDRILKGDLRGIEAVEVREIHHRANHSFCAKGRFCRIFGRSLRKFKEKLKSEG
ncbi:hypothetical protein Prudu_018875 [Prunus dulcis]|uniref:Uncharacterized protein n=1 Tax=Prunus dulcis TaxID=3755 RepID=A0A4Y1RTH5_PRUDU|nr:hypothetical protein Prudu_018875 [Prunus dulcis]